MDDRTEANRAMWDEWAQIHVGSDFYEVEKFRAGETTLRSIELEELGEVEGKSVLHLMCHFGLDTMSLSRMGAVATGIDFSPKAIEIAESLAVESALDTRFICSDVYGLPDHLDETFDIVFTSYGVLTWLSDLDQWASLIARYLKPGGIFHIVEQHPAGGIYDDSLPPRVVSTYFRDGPEAIATTQSYADREAKVEAEIQYQWRHPLGNVLTAIAAAGLRIEFLHEFPISQFQRRETMQKAEDGWWHLPDDFVPMLFSLKATKPG